MSSIIVYDTLQGLLNDGINHFSEIRHDATSELILQYLFKIRQNLGLVKTVALDVIGRRAHLYDVTPAIQANGYRSLLTILESLLKIITKSLRTILLNCNDTFFRGNQHADKLRLCSDILHQLRGLFYYAQILMDLTPNGDLHVDESNSEPLMHDCEVLAKACFYSSLHGFQYSSGVLPIVNALTMFVAQYDDIQQPSSVWKTVTSAISSSRYMVSPDLRGEKLEEVYNGGDIHFFKKFWSINELGIIQAVPNLVAPWVAINKSIHISPEPFYLNSDKNGAEAVRITFTSSLGNSDKQINLRLISAQLHDGQANRSSNIQKSSRSSMKSKPAQPKSKNLVFFCHGGGFVALTSKSYEIVLRQWSKDLGCPVLSVDYSLAPEAPFPEGFEECFYAYAWALKHAEELGTTAENVVFAGDSAGGNLVLSVALVAGMYGIRMPNSIVTMYPACIVRYSASPARLMSVMDPLLPLGLLAGCLGAYSGVTTEKVKREAPISPANGDSSKPTVPSKQSVNIRYFSNLVRDVGDGFNRLRTSSSFNQSKPTRSQSDEMFSRVTDDKIDGSDASNENGHPFHSAEPFAGFKVKLPHNFQPLKSKFFGDHFRMRRSAVVKNAFLSPALASDEMLSRLPHVDIVACEFDPLLDDSVVLAKRLQNLGKSYQFHVVRGLPHGFLNLQLAKEARESSKMCLELVRKGLYLFKP